MRVSIRLLGGFQVSVDGRAVPADAWHRRSAAALVKLLALQPGLRAGREQVIDALWPELLLDEAAPRLHTAAHYARSALGVRDAVVLSNGAVALFPGAETTVDVVEFDRAADAARADGRPEAAAAALDRYGGDLLPEDPYEPWAAEPRSRRRLRHLDLLRRAGRFQELVEADPLDEQAHLALVRDHLRHGRAQSALRALDRMTDVLRRELGADPGPAAAALRSAADEMLAAARPPVPQRIRRSTIPAPRNRLIGRGQDLDVLADLLRDRRLVTISGPGGAGKSTLALAAARRHLAAAGPDGDVVVAELAPARDRSGVVRVVAEAAGVQGEGARELGRLAASLGSRPVLLVLDNCEHLLDASAALVDAVLDAGERARILVTSREPLRVDGEVVHRIGSLGPDAPELFLERASAVVGPGAVDPDDPRVAELCRRLDGLPLAIELAAAQLQHLSLPVLVDRLDDLLTLLVGGRPRAGERHSTLTATVRWSYDLLSESSRRLFDRIGAFPAGFDLAAASAVADETDPVPVPVVLGDLVGKSLVVHDADSGRYRLLETIRMFAARRLAEAGLAEEVTERIRRTVVARATSQPRSRVWLSTSLAAHSRDDLENVRLAFAASLERGSGTDAVDVALALSTLWRNAVSYVEGQRWITRLHASELSARDRLWVAILEADVALGSGSPRLMASATADAVASVDVASVHDAADPAARVIVDTYAAMLLLVTPAAAVARLEAVRDRARSAGEPALERIARAYLVVAHQLLGETEGLAEEGRLLIEAGVERNYDRYISIWAAFVVALAARDGAGMRELMDIQLADLAASGLRENWLTMFSDALAMIAQRVDHLPQLERARARAEAEGRRADADTVLALAYAAAVDEDWELAAELLAAVRGAMHRDTAGFLHHSVICEQLVRPRLDPDAFAAAEARGERRDLAATAARATRATSSSSTSGRRVVPSSTS